MKSNTIIALHLPCLAACLILSFAESVSADEIPKEKAAQEAAAAKEEITATGVVFSVEPDLLSVVMKDNPTPVRFSYGKSTPFLDENGAAVPMDLVRAELPLTVHYVMNGEKMVANRVVMSRSMVAGDANAKPAKKRQELAAEKAKETNELAEIEQAMPQEVMGTVATIEQTISIVARGEKTPTSCIINNSTRFVNISGQPVSPHMIIGGMPVTIKSIRDGKRVIAQEIVIRGNAATISGNGTTRAGGNGNGNDTGQSESNNSSQNNGNRGAGGGNGFNDLMPIQGYVIPGQGSGQIGAVPGNSANPINPGNPAQPANPGQATAAQPNAAQPGVTQPNTQQPNTVPAGGTQNPNQNANGSSGNGNSGSNNNNNSNNNSNGTNRQNNNGNTGTTGSSGNNSGANRFGGSGTGNSSVGGSGSGTGSSSGGSTGSGGGGTSTGK